MSNVININMRRPDLKDTRTLSESISSLKDHKNFVESLKWIIYNSKDPVDTYIYTMSLILDKEEMEKFLLGTVELQSYLNAPDHIRGHIDKFFELRLTR